MSALEPTHRTLIGATTTKLLVGATEAGRAQAAELDAELLAACAEFQRIETASYAVTGDDETDSYMEKQQPVMERIAALHAATPAGLAAKVGAVITFFESDQPEEGLPCGKMLWSLLQDVAGHPSGIAPAVLQNADADTDLLAACAAYHHVRQQWKEADIPDERCDQLCAQDEALLKQISNLTPQTPEGLRAKALAGQTALMALAKLRRDRSWRDQASLEIQIAVDALGQMSGREGGMSKLQPPAGLAGATGSGDIDLLSLAAQVASWEAATQALNEAPDSTDSQMDRVLDAYWVVADETRSLPATPLAGLRAKARVLRSVIWQLGQEPSRIADHTDALIAAVLGEDAA